MRTRRYANVERIRSKERRLVEVLRRREAARTTAMLPRGFIGDLVYTAVAGGTSATIHTPLLAVVDTAQEVWQVDFDAVPDPTGGFDDVTIEAGRQISELAADAVFSFAGKASGTYVLYAAHSLDDENSETRDPPGQYASGTGANAVHNAYYGLAHTVGDPIPRDDYDNSLTSVAVSEAVDRLTITLALEASVPAAATKLLKIVWSGTQITSVAVAGTKIDLKDVYTHIGAGGSAHAAATSAAAGFMSAADKAKLDTIAANAKPYPYTGLVSSAGVGSYLPTGWTTTKISTGRYRITHNAGVRMSVACMPLALTTFIISNGNTSYFDVYVYDTDGSTAFDNDFQFVAVPLS